MSGQPGEGLQPTSSYFRDLGRAGAQKRWHGHEPKRGARARFLEPDLELVYIEKATGLGLITAAMNSTARRHVAARLARSLVAAAAEADTFNASTMEPGPEADDQARSAYWLAEAERLETRAERADALARKHREEAGAAYHEHWLAEQRLRKAASQGGRS